MSAPAQIPQVLSDIPDWANWAGLILTVLGVMISIIGLVATFLQARAAKDAAVEAKDAAKLAIEKMRSKSLFSSLLSTINQIRLMKEFISSDQIVAARVCFDECSQNIKEIFYNLEMGEFLDETNAASHIDVVLKELSAVLDLHTISDTRKAAIYETLRALTSRMSSEEAKRRWADL